MINKSADQFLVFGLVFVKRNVQHRTPSRRGESAAVDGLMVMAHRAHFEKTEPKNRGVASYASTNSQTTFTTGLGC